MAFQRTTTDATRQCVVDSKLLTGLPEGTPIVKYNNMKKLKNIIDTQSLDCSADSSKSPFLIVTCVDNSFFKALDNVYPDSGPRITYNFEEGGPTVILEVMKSTAQEMATGRLHLEIVLKLGKMGVEYELVSMNESEIQSLNKTWRKQPDLAFGLDGHTRWPVLVIETGMSETQQKLAIDAQGWLEAQGSDTKVVITMNIDKHSPRITFQRWEHAYTRHATRSHHPHGSVVQTVEVFHKGVNTRATGELIIPFEKVFGRMRRGRKEADIIITKNQLIRLGELVWAEQRFM
ncbi:hypothetical protein TMEN_6280 [Trichophyton mentagrophytes]|uniref:Uncharacterized protein n=1 Tax=Trichophyton interdigitale (strain MR816) TaxID=1215338 RepID=A0A059J4P6_TRIIM|nr:hypothetical protein H101_02123 [Trichophyton interdigitale H6]KDB22820.1 hypothetical protein H109_05276 [Trichophyton interdigitale MR816]GBF63323.1 hypothetical protein TMEN_5948 [Trichophyton mentagrophytes]GBF63369.1 hypothetical protein TMEN_5994 [Trichophyton mentagrophytes]GBF63641.1 hypothetical protein TMEN_6280 [Trichophyton mentagrophytes]